MKNVLHISPFIRMIIGLFGIVLIVFILIMTKAILIPLTFALIFSFLLHPLCRKLEKMHVPPPLAALLCIIFIFILLGGIIFLVSLQVSNLTADIPVLKTKVESLLNDFLIKFGHLFGWSHATTKDVLNESLNNSINEGGSVITTTVSITSSAITTFIILLVSTFFFLYYRMFFKQFVYKIFKGYNHRYVKQVMIQMQSVVQNYIVGLATVIAIIGILNSLGLFILGVKYALFFGLFGALLNVIPYVGVLVGGLLPTIYALITKDSLWYPVGVIGIYWTVQILEANLITPNIVGSKVSLNPFAAILAILVGEQIWGIAGMILAIPVLAICKVVFDTIEPLKPIGFVLGEPGSEKQKRKSLL